MHQKVKDLAILAGMSPMNRRSDGKYVVGEEAFEKLADLVIQECLLRSTIVGITADKSALGPNPIKYTRLVNSSIRKTFGIKYEQIV
jgi:hypothetical protein